MSITTEPTGYTFIIDCALRIIDGEYDDDHGHDGMCDYRWICGTCLKVLGEGGVCPEHTPMEFPGLRLLDCDATPRHITFVHTDNGYGVPCPWCQWTAAEERHAGCEHSHHGRWRSWRITGRVSHWGAMLGAGGFTSIAHQGRKDGCRGCHTRWRWGGSSHTLWRHKDWWACLLKRRHFRKPDQYNLCTVCTPPLPDDWDAEVPA